ncbi:sugar-binding domain-containing protein [Marinilabilia rubra]|uniref:Beta-galactosidase n=1 Tax=Marinilabilia rubra TaxID=2162893 RepID=A0A2U2B8H9_9BACT|nr:sugar-binding domain-containing protein [Marinilabilia rubra]PWD99344.1 hypothetical protein DDZ16_10045 [Marinilabilia rubra]
MKTIILIIAFVCSVVLHGYAQGRIEIPYNSGWEFKMSKESKEVVLSEKKAWTKINIPHDYSMELDFYAPVEESEHPENIGDLGLMLGSRSTAYLPSGIGWYKKSIELPDDYKNKKVQILFDGVYRMSDVWINNKYLGHHNNGYTAFYYDLTPYLKEGDNTIVVKTKNELKSRWYSGSGIYRDVKLLVTDKTHIPIWGRYVTTPQVSQEQAEVLIETTLKNEKFSDVEVTLIHRVVDSNGKEVAQVKVVQEIKKGREITSESSLTVSDPKLWSLESPNLYELVTDVFSDGKLIDNFSSQLGIRSLEFSVEKGFLLNGKFTKLKGACIHHANGLLGSESYVRSEERKILALKEMGCNAIRCAHNPPSKTFLDLCDKYGMLIINEAFDEWKRTKTGGGYSVYFEEWWEKDLTAMLLRDRNHPSIIMWSIGNEIPEQGYPEEGPEIARMLAAHVKTLDVTRPTTLAVQPGTTEMWANRFPPEAFFDAVDISGYNYEEFSIKKGGGFVENHVEFPDRIMYHSESRVPKFYDNWQKINSLNYVLGDFIWTGIDYLGEVGCGYDRKDQSKFPTYFAMCGDLDICLNRKPRSFYRNIVWSNVDDVYMQVRQPKGTGYDTPHKWAFTPGLHSWEWNLPEGKMMTVDVFSAADEIELFLNGKSIGKKKPLEKIASFEAPYLAGELKAVSYKNGKKSGENFLKTPGASKVLVIKAEREKIKADISEVIYVNFEIIGENGTRNILSDREVTFQIDGPATIAAIGTADPSAPIGYRFHGTKCKTFQGRGQLVLRSNGKAGVIKINAKAKGLKIKPVRVIAE